MNISAQKREGERLILIALSILIVVIYLFPFYIVVVNAFKTSLETAENAVALPGTLILDNFREAAKKINFSRSIRNSVIVTAIADILIVAFSSMSGYAIARYSRSNRFFRFLDKAFMSSQMLPFQVVMIPVYKLFRTMGLLNTLAGEIIMLTGMSVAYASFLYVGFVKSVPYELEEAAHIDGAGPFRTFCVVVFPLLKPITATVASLHAMWLWNDFNVALLMLQKDLVRTLTIKQFYFFSQYSADYNMAFAASLMGMVPVLIFFMLMQKYLVSGITGGAVKG